MCVQMTLFSAITACSPVKHIAYRRSQLNFNSKLPFQEALAVMVHWNRQACQYSPGQSEELTEVWSYC